jgi:hypothetical protein
MRRFALMAALVAATPLAAQANPGSVAGLGVLSRLVGEWEGDAWAMRPEGRFTVRQREWVALEAGGTVLAVRGIGTLTMNGQDRVIHHAFAVIHQNHEKTGIMMRAFTAEGHWLDPRIELTANGYTWYMNDPRIGDVRYEMKIDEQGRWVEDGYASRDQGKTWTHFMGMVLTKK